MREGSDHTIYRNPRTGVPVNRVIVADSLDAEIAKLPESILKKTPDATAPAKQVLYRQRRTRNRGGPAATSAS